MGWHDRYYRICKAGGIAVELRNAGDPIINACLIEAHGNELNINIKLPNLMSLKELAAKMPVKEAFALNISGRGVLHKQLQGVDMSDEEAFAQAMPNSKSDDFYTQRVTSSETTFISLIRKAEADRWITELAHSGCEILSLSLGPFPIYPIQSSLNYYDGELRFAGNVIGRDDKKEWQSLKIEADANAKFPVKIGNEIIEENLLIPYAAALQLILAGQIEPVMANNTELGIKFNDLLNNIRLKANVAVILCAFFLLLLANFIVLSELSSANNQLMQQTSVSSVSINDVQKTYNELKKRRSLVNVLGWEGGTHKSVLIDEVGALLPDEITWSKLEVDPVDMQQSRDRKAPFFDNKRIKISGTSQKVIAINEWMARIKTRHWVKNVQLESYNWNNELNTGEFKINIDY